MPRLPGVPVLLYHGLTTGAEADGVRRDGKYWIRDMVFREHLSLIHRGGYRVALLRDLWGPAGAHVDPGTAVVLTFDDGRASDYDSAFPLLLEAGVQAEFFLNTASIDDRGFLGWAQIGEMRRAGMSFQSHSHDHVALVGLPTRQVERQLTDSKRLLEDGLGRAVDFMAVPYGFLNGRIVKCAQAVGYRAVCSSRQWPARPGARTVSRVAVYRHTTTRHICRLLEGNPGTYLARRMRSAFLYLPKRLLLRFHPGPLGVRLLEREA